MYASMYVSPNTVNRPGKVETQLALCAVEQLKDERQLQRLDHVSKQMSDLISTQNASGSGTGLAVPSLLYKNDSIPGHNKCSYTCA